MFGIGLGKEFIWDEMMGKGVKSNYDILLDGAGCVGGMMITVCVWGYKDNKLNKYNIDYYDSALTYKTKRRHLKRWSFKRVGLLN